MPTVSVNTQFPGYELLSELGRGNARVVKARHVATGDLVAIKQFALNADADTRRRFGRESEIMTRISHPNVVKVREIQLDAAMPYVVMEFVEGGDLRSLLTTRQGGQPPNSLDVPTTIRLGLQMAEAFRAIHPQGIVHRDIKPENILYRRLVSGELHFLLTDFGIAKIRADDGGRTRTGHSLMTYEYASPEQFDNPRNVETATDYYSLGAVLYECLSGRTPFVLRNDAGLASFMQLVLTGSPPALVLPSERFLPPSFDALLRGLLTKRADARLQTVDELELLLEQAKVEQLRANRPMPSAPPSIEPSVQTITQAGPTPLPAPAPANDRKPTREPYAQPSSTGQGWWIVVLTLIVAGGMLAFVLLNPDGRRFHRASPTTADSAPLTSPDSTAQSTPIDNEIEASDPSEKTGLEEAPTDGNNNPSSTSDPDSTAVQPVPIAPPDSVAAPPDSAQ